MKESIVSSLSELQDGVRYGYAPLFRGVSEATFPLLPRVGRNPKHAAEERELLNLFRRLAEPFLQKSPLNDWEWLSIAQHHGLPTRLMDWTKNPFVAAFFAVRQPETQGDSAIWILEPANSRITSAAGRDSGLPLTDIWAVNEKTVASPFEVKEVGVYLPRHVSPRIQAQGGLFTVHPNPTEPLQSPSLAKAVIPKHRRAHIRKDLRDLDFHDAKLFPDLDGQAAYVAGKFAEETFF